MSNTVGELKKLLENYPDDMPVTFLDDEGTFCDPIGVISVEHLGRFCWAGGEEFYRKYRRYAADVWIRDEEVLVLG